MPAPEVKLLIGGVSYAGWKDIRITLSLESLAGSFSLAVSDRWGDDRQVRPIRVEDACKVIISDNGRDQVVIDGFVDGRENQADATSRNLTYTGKDRAGALVENSLLVGGASVKSSKWTYYNLDIAKFTRQVAEPHGIKVSVQPGLVLPVDPRLVAHVGESGFEAVRRTAGSAQVLVVSDAKGGIIITRSGTQRAAPLVEGFNIRTASIKEDATNRFRKYIVSTQAPGSDAGAGDDDDGAAASQIEAEAFDLDVRRADRTIIIRPEKGSSVAEARRRAEWEARIRAAQAATVKVTVQGWQQPDGSLWPLNALTTVSAPTLIDVDGEMLISQVEYSLGDGGQVTQLSLVRPDALTPQPQTAVVSGEGLWLISKGGKFVEPGK